MADMLPPVIYTLRSNATQFIASQREARAALAKTAAEGDATGGKFSAYSKTAGKAAAVAAVAVAGASVKMAADFQSQMTLLQTAGGELSSNMKTVSNGILGIATSTGTSTSQLAEGMYTIEKAGIRGSDGLKVLKAAAEGAKAENVDLGTATNALTSVMMSYHLKASDAVKVQNELIAGSGMAKTTMQEYAGSLSSVIPVASAAGIGFDQVGGAIATLTQHGTSAQEATQELANTIRNLQAPNSVAIRAMQQLGLNVNDVEKNLGKRGLTGTISLVTDAIEKKMGPAGMVVVDSFRQSQSATSDLNTMLGKMPADLRKVSDQFLAGKIGMKAYKTDIKQLGAQGYAMGSQFMSLAERASGFNDLLKSGNPAAQTFAAELKRVMGGATGMNTALMLGGENMPYFTKAVADVGAAGQKTGKDISTWGKTSKTLNVQLDQVKQQVEVLAIKIGQKLLPIISAIVGFIAKHTTVIEVLAGLIGGLLVTAMTAWIASVVTATVTLGEMEIAVAPIVLALAGLALAGYELYKHWDTIWGGIKKLTGVVVGFVKDAFSGLLDLLKTWGPLALSVLAPFIGLPLLIWQHWSQITGFLTTVWGTVRPFLKTWGPLALSVLVPFIGIPLLIWQHFDQIKDFLVNAWNPVWHFLKTWGPVALSVLMPFIGIPLLIWQHFDKIKGYVTSAFDKAGGAIKSAINGFMDFVKNGVAVISDLWKGIAAGLQWAYDHTIKPILDGIKTAIDKVKSALHALSNFNSVKLNNVVGLSPAQQAALNAGHNAQGTMNWRGGLTWVGENGPELLNLPTGSKIIPQSSLGNLGTVPVTSYSEGSGSSGAAGGDTYVVVQGSVIDAEGLFRAVQEAALRHGVHNSQTWAPYQRR